MKTYITNLFSLMLFSLLLMLVAAAMFVTSPCLAISSTADYKKILKALYKHARPDGTEEE